MPVRKSIGALTALALLLAACAAPAATSTDVVTERATTSAQPTTAQTTQGNTSITLTIWLPPQFDTAGGSPAASILADRLTQFTDQHSQVQIITRIKAEQGAGGMLDSLLTAQQAAPLALPDLVLLPGGILAAAAQSEIVQPLATLSNAQDTEDWYPFGLQMAAWNGTTYGVPFVADALILAYRSTAIDKAQTSWQDVLKANYAFGFPAGGAQALFALTQLKISETQTADAESQITDQALTDFFEFLSEGQEVFPFWLTQYQTNEQIWQAFTEGRVPMTIAWTSQLFDSAQSEIVGAPLPTQDGQPFTLAKGWVWTIVATNPAHVQAAADLIDFLSAPEFMAQYSAAAGLLPTRASSLAAWSPDADQALASQIITSISALPGDQIVEKWGKALSPAVISILKHESIPAEAVESVRTALSESQ